MFVELLLLVTSIVVLILFFHVRSKPRGTPPGAIGLPIIGVMPPSDCTFEEHINNCRKKYGDTFWLKMGSRNIVFLNDYEDIVTAFNNPLLQGRPDFLSYETFYISKGKGVAFSDGIEWRNLRRFSLRCLKDGGMGKSSMESVILREAEALAVDFERHVGKPTEMPWSINASILNIIWKLVTDERYDIYDPEIHQFYITLTDLFNQWQGPAFVLLDFMPWIGNWSPEFVQNLFGKKTFKQKRNKICELFHHSIKEHKKTLDEGNPRDFIDSYLVELNKMKRDKNSQSEAYSTFSENELTNTIFDLFLGGSETTSSTLRWYLLLMAKYPQIQKRVHEELDKVIPRDRTVSIADRENLPFFESTIFETLRLKPVLPVSLFHTAVENAKINDYLIPKGTLILANFLVSHKNPDFWEKPSEFHPEHFLKEDNTFDLKKRGLLSFSVGRRVCIGETLAKINLFVVLAILMQKFSFTAPDGEILSLEQIPEQPFFTIPKPFKLIINKR